ncbi:hypothetical protein Aperf_G00000111941 [Anoplocephala perfoliata]
MNHMIAFDALFIICIFVVCNAQNLGFGTKLKCYQCNSRTQPHCGDPFDNRTFILEPCPDNGQNYSRCMKKLVEFYYDRKWIRRIERSCAVEGEIGRESGRWCHTVGGTQRVIARYCYCNNKQGCNRARPKGLNSFLLVIPVVLSSTLLDHMSQQRLFTFTMLCFLAFILL